MTATGMPFDVLSLCALGVIAVLAGTASACIGAGYGAVHSWFGGKR